MDCFKKVNKVLKDLTKNIVLISLLVIVNLAIFVFCRLLTDPENYLWYKTAPEKVEIVAVASLDIMRVKYFVYANSINFFLMGVYFAYYYRKTLGFLVALSGIAVFFGGNKLFEESVAENYYIIFKNQSVSEDFAFEPLKSAGNTVGKYLMKDVNSKIVNRKQVIMGLGEIRYEPSIDVLDALLNNEKESPEIRGEAYLALLKMNSERSAACIRIFLGSFHPITDQEVMDYIKAKSIG